MSLLLLFNGGSATISRQGRRGSVSAALVPGLVAMRYTTARDVLLERMDRPANIGIRWALPGGLQRLELTIKANSRRDAYERYTSHHGDYIAIMDIWCNRPIASGYVYEIVPDGQHVTYIVEGAWKRHNDQYETDSPASAATSSDSYLKSILTAHVPAVSSTQTYVLATGTNMGAVFEVDSLIGERPSSVVETVVSLGTSSSGEALDYWLVENFLNGIYPQLPLPYLVGRNSLATYAPTYRLTRAMLKDFSMSTNIYKLENNTVIYYTPSTTLAADSYARDTRTTIADTAYQTISVASASNIANEQEIEISLDSGESHRATVINVDGTSITIDRPLPGQATKLSVAAAWPDTTITVDSITGFVDGDSIAVVLDNGDLHETDINGTPSGSDINIDAIPSAAAIGNAVMILAASSGNVVKRSMPLKAITAVTDSASQSAYWTRYYREAKSEMDSTQAAQYGALRQAAYSSYAQQASFSIGTRYIYAGRTKIPVWRLLINPGLLIIDDLFANENVLDATLDGANVFRPVALDYDHATPSMRVTPDSLDGDSRVDVYMQRLGFEVGQMIQRDTPAYRR